MKLKLHIITLPLVGLSFCGCLVVEAIEVPFTVTNFALDTTSKVINIGSKIATTTADIGAKVIEAKTPDLPPVNLNITN